MNFIKLLFYLLIFVTIIFVFNSCDNEKDVDTSCSVNTDCEKGEYCSDKACIKACVAMGCGWDNGVDCGVCSDSNDYCKDNICINKCIDIECGENRGLDCGVCNNNSVCVDNKCQTNCINMTCGTDNGTNCGTCGAKQICNTSNQCEDICVDMTCGIDSEISCGTCEAKQICNASNQCEDICVDMTCGVDNGISCGICSDDEFCNVYNKCSDLMVLIPAGSFMMGCDGNSCNINETPYHEVLLDAYKIDVFEVTVAKFKECVDADICKNTEFSNNVERDNCNYGDLTRENFPMNCLTWNVSKKYCEWKGKRLPTAAEWEKAARGTDERVYPWGNEFPTCDYAIFDEYGNGCGANTTWRVGSKEDGKSFYNLYDMSGNVMEWVSDFYESDYYIGLDNPVTNPKGPDSGIDKELRGGGWLLGAEFLTSYYRDHKVSGSRNGAVGFRCVKSE